MNTIVAPYIYRGEDGERAPYNIQEIIIDKDVTKIRDSAFIGRRFLKRVTMHENVVHIGKYAFSGCTCLKPFALSSNLEYIGKFAFNRCHSLEAVFLPSSVIWVGSKAFRDCRSLRFCLLPDTIDFVNDGAFDLCYRLLTTSNFQYVWNDDTGACKNNHDVNGWLVSRHDSFPLHTVCYNVNVTVDDIRQCIRMRGEQCATLVDDQRMTAFHIVAANPHASPESMRVCFDANPAAAFAKDKYGCTPVHYLCKYGANTNPSILEGVHWLRGATGCFDVGCDVTNVTPLQILIENGQFEHLSLVVAISHTIVWLDPILKAALKRDGQILMKKDAETGLNLFMLAAVGDKANLCIIYKLLRLNPGLIDG